ncbi:MAG: hypothetical protein Q9161_001015 [Pseudevernia consocians]
MNTADRAYFMSFEQFISEPFIGGLQGSQPPTVQSTLIPYFPSPSLYASVQKICQGRQKPDSRPFEALFLMQYRFPIAMALAYEMTLSRPLSRPLSRLTGNRQLINALTPGLILLGEFLDTFRARVADFVTDPANAGYFSFSSPKTFLRRGMTKKIEREILAKGYESRGISLIHATYLWLVELLKNNSHAIDFLRRRSSFNRVISPLSRPGPGIFECVSTIHDIFLFGGLETVLVACQTFPNAAHIDPRHTIASRLCTAVSAPLPTQFTPVQLPASDLVPVLEASTAAKMKMMLSGVHGDWDLVCPANMAHFSLAPADTDVQRDDIKYGLMEDITAPDWNVTELLR